jgi:trehalose synthase
MYPLSRVSKDDRRGLAEVSIASETLDRFASVLDVSEYNTLLATANLANDLLAGRVVWNVSSTARGGGVAEMLNSLVPMARGAGVDARWLVIEAEKDFFRLTKRIHNRLHGDLGDGGSLATAERQFYERTLQPLGLDLLGLVRPRDIVILHDPQTAGLAPAVRRLGARVIWRCHIGVDVPNAFVESAWEFLRPYLDAADACVFTRLAYAWAGIPREKVVVIPPSIDVFAPKNQELTQDQVRGILVATGMVEGSGKDTRYVRVDGSIGAVFRRTELLGGIPVPESVPIVTQISRWDRFKDPLGLVQAFAEHIAPRSTAHLVVAGPAVVAVSDDPEGAETLAEVRARWSALADDLRMRIHLVCVPMDDSEENAAIINALQRRAAVVVQKSLAEGFGLTVAEAMWKKRPIVASCVGGIRDQIVDNVSGLLVEPRDLRGFATSVLSLLGDPSLAASLARAAHRRCREEYLAPKHLQRYVRLFEALL